MLALTLAAAALATTLIATDVMRPLELITIDARFAVRGSQPARARRVLIVAIDSATLQALGRFPIPRHYYAAALDRLRRERAQITAIDVQFSEQSTQAEDNALIEGLRRSPGTILVTTETGAGGANSVLGGVDAQHYARVRVASGLFPLDVGGTYRSFNLGEGGLPTLPVLTASVARHRALSRGELGRPPVPIDYAGGPGTFDTVSLAQLLSGGVPAARVSGRIVVLGETAATGQDMHEYSALDRRQMTGVEIEANAIITALEQARLRGIAGWLATLLTFVLTLAAPSLMLVGPRIGSVALAAITVGYLAIAQILFAAGDLVPVANPIIGLLIGAAVAAAASFLRELRRRSEHVQAARQRSVYAADQARRRIERDLHDGVQQRLLALAMRLSAPGAKADRELLQGSAAQLKLALGELRELARGTYPAVLAQAGLPAALQSLADHAQLPVAVTANGLESLPEAVQQCAYFTAAESLANTIKHAGASRVTIEARQEGCRLRLVISDDGRGGADVAGGGLSGLAERAAAAGGSLTVDSRPGAGTTVALEIRLDQGEFDPDR